MAGKKRVCVSLNMLIKLITYSMVIILIFSSIYIYFVTKNTLDSQIVNIGNSAVTIAGHTIDQKLLSIDDYVFELMYNNSAVSELNMGTLDELSSYTAKAVIQEDLERIARLHSIDGIMLYSPQGQTAERIVHSVSSVLFQSNLKVVDSLIGSIDEGRPISLPKSEWFLLYIDEQVYLARMFLLNQAYLCIWFREELMTDVLLQSSPSSQIGGEYYLEDGVAAAQKSDGNSRVLRYPSAAGDFTVSLTAFRADFDMNYIFAMLGLGVFLVSSIALILFLSRRIMYRPLQSFSQTMQRIGDGNLAVRMNETSHVYDFNEIYAVFNQLIDNIQTLKLDVYEKELSKQRVEQQFLHIQLRNHFFLNCLNILYALAQTKDCELIQQMVLYLVGYFRHISQDGMKPVSLLSEIEHVKDYISIQQIRFPGRIQFNYTMDAELESFLVPPLIILTFIENSIVHAQGPKRSIMCIDMELIAKKKSDGTYLCIHISDNGRGFTSEQLKMLNAPVADVQIGTEHGIGIHNIRNRLNLLYGNKALLIISNAPLGHGAVIEMELPPWPKQVELKELERGEDV
ncbi:MAG TPA: histidine kinase [Candidatus Pullichristensenella excrementipullorum]|nr:histidine kinase [Candidatus Pullichristensenella excrementipullorum]